MSISELSVRDLIALRPGAVARQRHGFSIWQAGTTPHADAAGNRPSDIPHQMFGRCSSWGEPGISGKDVLPGDGGGRRAGPAKLGGS